LLKKLSVELCIYILVWESAQTTIQINIYLVVELDKICVMKRIAYQKKHDQKAKLRLM
jgi:hypothetical protein